MNTNSIAEADSLQQQLDFYSIDDPFIHWSDRFPICMLKAARIILKNDLEVMNVSPQRMSRVMSNPKNFIPGNYSPLEIRSELYKYWGEIRGGGIKIEWTQTVNYRYRSVPHYDFTLSKILTAEDLMIPKKAA